MCCLATVVHDGGSVVVIEMVTVMVVMRAAEQILDPHQWSWRCCKANGATVSSDSGVGHR